MTASCSCGYCSACLARARPGYVREASVISLLLVVVVCLLIVVVQLWPSHS